MDKNKPEDLTDIGDLNKKYNHYVDDTANDDEVGETRFVDESEASQEFEDVSSYSSEAASDLERYDSVMGETEDEEPKSKKKRITKIVAICLVVAILLTGGGILAYIIKSTQSEGYNDSGIDYNEFNTDDDYLDDSQHDFSVIGDVNADSLNAFLRKWATNGGEKMYNKNIINVLLCGVESTTGNASSGRADSMILISVNKETEKITMCSFLRDSWTYIQMPKQDGSTSEYYFKMNSAYNGGPATLMKTIEDNYKIEIDQFIAVDFVSFPKLIDALGGVTVEVKEYEAMYIRRTSSQTNFPYGKSVKLNGKQALIYSRIRKLDADSDLSRTRRQQKVIKSLIASAKTATNGQLVNAFKQVSSYLRTGYSQSEVIKLIAQAYSHNWMDFEMVEMMLPNEDNVDRIGGMLGDQWAWVVDYPLCAQKLQMAIYGETNIKLSADRDSALDFVTNKRDNGSDGNNSYTQPSSNYSNNRDNDDNENEYTNTEPSSEYTEPLPEPTSEDTEPSSSPIIDEGDGDESNTDNTEEE